MKKNKIEQLAEAVDNLSREIIKVKSEEKNKDKFRKKSNWKKFRANVNKGEKW